MNTATNGYYARVSLGFAAKLDTDLIAFTKKVTTLMTGNTQYPSPSPTLAVITTAVDDFETKVHDALNGGKIAIAARNAARVELLSLMRQLASYVQGNCGADLLLLLTSGFEAVRAPSKAGILPAPRNPSLSLTDKSGELLFKFDRVVNAANYTIETATSAAGPWTEWDISSTSRVVIDGLTPGQTYWARARANGTAGPSDWTVPTSSMAM